jgi:ubiquinone/menaquinone biosynthesis C-methylase UbiE
VDPNDSLTLKENHIKNKAMSNERDKRVCPVELAGGLDNFVRRLLQNPKKILRHFISEGTTVLDLGCGPGVFSTEIAKMVGNSGKVIAADLQEGMLEKVRQKIMGTELEKRIWLHKCESDKTGVTEKVDFVLCFYMIHEVPDQDKLFKELKSILKPGGKIFIIEPIFHVTKTLFEEMITRARNIGFEIISGPKVFYSRTVLFSNKK